MSATSGSGDQEHTGQDHHTQSQARPPRRDRFSHGAQVAVCNLLNQNCNQRQWSHLHPCLVAVGKMWAHPRRLAECAAPERLAQWVIQDTSEEVYHTMNFVADICQPSALQDLQSEMRVYQYGSQEPCDTNLQTPEFYAKLVLDVLVRIVHFDYYRNNHSKALPQAQLRLQIASAIEFVKNYQPGHVYQQPQYIKQVRARAPKRCREPKEESQENRGTATEAASSAAQSIAAQGSMAHAGVVQPSKLKKTASHFPLPTHGDSASSTNTGNINASGSIPSTSTSTSIPLGPPPAYTDKSV
jgi:hypothetical protein